MARATTQQPCRLHLFGGNKDSFCQSVTVKAICYCQYTVINGCRYTWSNILDDPCLTRLDRIPISPKWDTIYILVSECSCSRITVDHVLLCLYTRKIG